jgi:hypothetical protein
VGTAKLESFLYFINKKLGTVFNGIISQHKTVSLVLLASAAVHFPHLNHDNTIKPLINNVTDYLLETVGIP